ncbi:MAG: hypothetical protein N2259_00465 [Patescibacteria group bacterium]|nr:hypothetical protein [Patescibacteria group bacterium]
MGFQFRNWQIDKDARKFRREAIKQILGKIPKTEKAEKLIAQLAGFRRFLQK